jgi:tRNA G18 (ribose-2'-O)-methylase SpoU
VYSENDRFQYYESLRRNRTKRHQHREFLVEGVRPINQALAHGWTINSWLYCPERTRSDWARQVMARSPAAEVQVAASLLAKLSGKQEPSELLALVQRPDDDLARIPVGPGFGAFIFDRPGNPGNLGTVIRTADAFGVNGVVVTGHAVDVYDPETISATRGSLFAVPVVRVGGPSDLRAWLAGLRERLPDLQVVGSSEQASTIAAAHDFTRPTVLVLGNERWGMAASQQNLCDAVVAIPMVGAASSLNVASAAAILLYEMDSQRRRWSSSTRI